MNRKIVSLDIGTCFIRTVIAEIDEEQHIQVIGLSKIPSQGMMRNGVIVNIEAALKTINEAISAAEQNAGVIVTNLYTAIGGSQIESLDSKGQIGVDPTGQNRRMEIKQDTKVKALQSARARAIPLDKIVLQMIPQQYIVDGAEYPNPIGVLGVRLEVKTHLVMASVTAHENIKQCISRAGYSLNRVTVKSLAAAYATIHEDEMDLGSILIDLGGGSTDVMVVNKGAPIFTTSIPFGGNRVTGDIAQVFGVPIPVAEELKLKFGTCWLFGGEEEQSVIVPGNGGLPPEETNRKVMFDIIEARLEEILMEVRKRVIENSTLTKLNGSIVLTGGGAMMEGIVELTQSVFGTSSVRIGVSADFGGLDDKYRDADFATAIGIILTNKHDDTVEASSRKSKSSQSGEKKSWWKNIFDKFI